MSPCIQFIQVWKWWEETGKKKDDGTKWTFLEHKGPLFAADYEPLPDSVRFYYDGKKMRLSEPTEEVKKNLLILTYELENLATLLN